MSLRPRISTRNRLAAICFAIDRFRRKPTFAVRDVNDGFVPSHAIPADRAAEMDEGPLLTALICSMNVRDVGGRFSHD